MSRIQELREKYGTKAEAIKELKAQYYIGTSDALKYLKTFENNDWPSQLTEEINKKLPKDAKYLATPDRVLELTALAHDFILDSSGKTPYGNSVDSNDFFNALFLDGDEKDMLKTLTEVFYTINQLGGKERTESTVIGISYILKEIQDHSSRVDKSIAELGPVDIIDFLSNVKDTMGPRNYSEFKKRERQCAIPYSKVLERVVNDLVDTNFEYQRQIALLYAESSDAKSHGELVRSAKKLLGTREKRLAKLRELNAPKLIKDNEEDLTKKGKTLIHILQSEKRFLEKLYQNGEIK